MICAEEYSALNISHTLQNAYPFKLTLKYHGQLKLDFNAENNIYIAKLFCNLSTNTLIIIVDDLKFNRIIYNDNKDL